MRKKKFALGTLAAFLVLYLALPAGAWHRTHADIFAILPPGATGPEGLTVGPDGNVYVATFGFNSSGPVSGNGHIYVYDPQGHLLRDFPVQHSTPFLLGLAFNPVTNDLLVLDTAVAAPSATPTVWRVDRFTGAASLFFTAAGRPGFNALTFDSSGNVYVSDSFQSTIWKCDKDCPSHVATAWVTNPLLGTTGVPPFGANGVEFNNEGTIMFVANTGNDTIVQIPVSNGTPGTPTVFVNSINGADGIAIDKDDNIWAAANQEDEIVVVDKTGKVIAKLGDFDGVSPDGIPHGLLFPASPAFSADGGWLYVTNLALDLGDIFGLPTTDSQWCKQVKHYTVSKIKARIPPVGPGNGNGIG